MSITEPHQLITPRTKLVPLKDSKVITQLLDHQSIRNSVFISTHKERLRITEWNSESIKQLVTLWSKASQFCGVYAIQATKNIGIVSVLPSGNENAGILLDVLIHPDFCGAGFATECAKAAVMEIFSKSPYQRVSSIATNSNFKWIRVLEKLGFSFHDNCLVQDEICQIYSITAPDFFELWIPEEESV
jgi:hypothetical protein